MPPCHGSLLRLHPRLRHQPDRDVSADTYDPARIDTELGWAEELGFNTMRVYLSSVVLRT